MPGNRSPVLGTELASFVESHRSHSVEGCHDSTGISRHESLLQLLVGSQKKEQGLEGEI